MDDIHLYDDFISTIHLTLYDEHLHLLKKNILIASIESVK